MPQMMFGPVMARTMMGQAHGVKVIGVRAIGVKVRPAGNALPVSPCCHAKRKTARSPVEIPKPSCGCVARTGKTWERTAAVCVLEFGLSKQRHL